MQIAIQAAFLAEAEPLIKALKLKKTEDSAFPIFENEEFVLTLSSLGLFNAIAAAASLLSKRKISYFCNFGTAGHRFLEVGTLMLPSKILSPDEKQTIYPHVIPFKNATFSSLKSLFFPLGSYHETHAYDMESFGFFHAAMKFLSIERIGCVKVISDNQDQAFDKSKVSSLIEEVIEPFLSYLKKAAPFSTEDDFSKKAVLFFEKWHFTEFQKCHFIQLLQKAETLKLSFPSKEQSFSSAKEVLSSLENLLETSYLRF